MLMGQVDGAAEYVDGIKFVCIREETGSKIQTCSH